jgi:cell division protein FtsZ
MPPMTTSASLPPVGLGHASGHGSAGNNLGLRSRGGESAAANTALADLPTDHSYLDIPAFLRRQAD